MEFGLEGQTFTAKDVARPVQNWGYVSYDHPFWYSCVNTVCQGSPTEDYQVIEALKSSQSGGVLPPAIADCDTRDETFGPLSESPVSVCPVGTVGPDHTLQSIRQSLDAYQIAFLLATTWRRWHRTSPYWKAFHNTGGATQLTPGSPHLHAPKFNATTGDRCRLRDAPRTHFGNKRGVSFFSCFWVVLHAFAQGQDSRHQAVSPTSGAYSPQRRESLSDKTPARKPKLNMKRTHPPSEYPGKESNTPQLGKIVKNT